MYCLTSIAYFVYKVYFCVLFKQFSLFCLQSIFCELFKLCWICQIGIRFFLISRSLILIQTFLYGQAGTEPRDILLDTDMWVVPTGITIDKCYTICTTSCREHKLKYRCTADLKFILFGFSCLVFVEWTTVLLVWSKPKQSNRRSAVLWYSSYGECSLPRVYDFIMR